jgi:hypothetical protein
MLTIERCDVQIRHGAIEHLRWRSAAAACAFRTFSDKIYLVCVTNDSPLGGKHQEEKRIL